MDTLAPRVPGPRPADPAAVVVDRARLDRAIVTLALVGRAPERAIAACLDELYEVRPSLGYVNGLLARAGAAAAAVTARLQRALPAGAATEVAADELFVGSQAQLVAVEPASLLVLAAAPPEPGTPPDAAAWQRVFAGLRERGVALRRVASDGGAALAAAVAALPGVEHQLDRWHALRHIGRAERALERTAYAAVKREYELAQKARGMDPAHAMGGYVWGRYAAARERAAAAIRRSDDAATVGGWAREALEALDPRTGRARGRAECLADLSAATALLRELGARAAEHLAAYLDAAGPGLLAYADRLQRDLAAAAAEWGERGEAGVRGLCREWLLQRAAANARPGTRAGRRLAYERARLAALLCWGRDYPAARARVVAVLEGARRGSSPAECVNSWLRPYADLAKGLGARFLPLFVLYRNARAFPRGKRAGRSPLELAGVAPPPGDWLEWLGLGSPGEPRPAPRGVRGLPQSRAA
jgi:hypothetical protein